MSESKPQDSKHPRESIKHWVGVTAEDIPPGWIDDMVKRLFEVTNRDMIRLEKVQLKESDIAADRLAVDAPEKALAIVAERQRLTTVIRRNLEKLSELKTKRAQPRKTERKKKAAKANDNSLEELERRIAELAAARGYPGNPRRSDA